MKYKVHYIAFQKADPIKKGFVFVNSLKDIQCKVCEDTSERDVMILRVERV